MRKLATIVTLFILFSSCSNTNPQENGLNKSEDSSNNSKSLVVDTARLNIDALMASPDNFKLLLENDYVRILEYSLKPGEKDTPHTHPPKASYVVTGGKIKVYPENGEALIFDEKAGNAYWGDYSGKHYVENIGTTTVTIVLTEIKSLQ